MNNAKPSFTETMKNKAFMIFVTAFANLEPKNVNVFLLVLSMYDDVRSVIQSIKRRCNNLLST